MGLSSGTKLGPFEIVAPIGAGGMGEVYRARDTKLGRDVALKVLPEVFAANTERMGRFQREAQVLASLNHPNIAAIYGLEESGALRALAMELVGGQTLEEIIAGRRAAPIASDEGLPIAKQIAEALEYAHDRGIIHRDLKPANIKVTPEGAVKVLDFGLAKALDATISGASQGPGSVSDSPLQNSPTLTALATQAGVIIGTAAYMAPEQARGKNVDRRADIWAFGCVLYEMFSGRRLFGGETVSDTLAAVIMKDPEWDALPATLPASIQRLIRRCLTKDPRQRLRDIGEARITIEEAIAGGGAVHEPSPAAAGVAPEQQAEAARRSLIEHALPWGLGVISVILAGLLALAYFTRPAAPAHPIRSSILPPAKVAFATSGTGGGGAVISPDGTRLVVPARDASGKLSLWVRQLDSLTMQPLEETEGGHFPFWSADSRYVGFFVEGKLKKIDVAGGPPQTICDSANGRGGTWNREDVIVFAPDVRSGLSRVPAAGGAPTPILSLDKSKHENSLRWPKFLPDGRHFVYWGGNVDSSAFADTSGIYTASLDGKDSRFLFKADSNAEYAPPGYLLFVREHSLMAQPFNAGGLKSNGDAFPIAEQVAVPESYQLAFFSVSQKGQLVYQTGGRGEAQIVSLDASGKNSTPTGAAGPYSYVRVSADGRQMAETVFDSQSKNGDIWVVDLTRGVRTRFTFDPKDDDAPTYSPDGSRIAFASNRGGTYAIYIKQASGAGSAQLLFKSDNDEFPLDWSRDGRFISLTQINSKNKNLMSIWILPMQGDKKPYPFLETSFNDGAGMFSPDGHWMAYESDESGRFEIYVVPFNGEASSEGGVHGGKWQVSQGGGITPTWSRDGKSLYFLGPEGKVMEADVNEKGSAIEVGIPREIFQTAFQTQFYGTRSFDISPDGRHFYVIAPQETAPVPITLVADWAAGLKK